MCTINMNIKDSFNKALCMAQEKLNFQMEAIIMVILKKENGTGKGNMLIKIIMYINKFFPRKINRN